ncbi:zona pellucida sperm-binding protein 3-like isoform X3 [Salvelinus fontinalis]|uniref:zona pellucida sperm-binding protein 3-like isoform X3 n=1 Tax=Salvelinus fontinalis TaxID=8038 RepID=UPI00248665E4|nr:zona pellucida sperm-binding protein 3-like isoform X3 [Salvelinus fontinalis]
MGLMMANMLRLLFKQLVWFLLVENFLISPALSYTYSTDTWQQLPRRTPQFDNRPRFKQPPLQQTVSRPVRVETVAVTCHSDYMEIVVKADLFKLGNLIDVDDLRLGVEQYQDQEHCRATASAARDEYRIFAALSDCGTKYLMNEDSLIYTNLLRYTPRTTPDGIIRMAGAVIPIECHYERKYSLNSSPLQPTWIPFTATVPAEDTLQFSLKLMTSDWLYERASGVYFLGDPINIEASVRVAHHTGLRVFVSSCVATLDPDSNSVPRYVFIESDGCLMDSQLPGSRSGFMRRTQDNKLGFHIDAFRFYQEDRAELYVTCHLMAVPVMAHAEPSNKACSFIDGRWRSADENDLLCGRCPSLSRQKGVDQAPAQHPLSPRLGGSQLEPRVYHNKASGDNMSIGMKGKKVWDQDTTLGPVMVLPSKQKSTPVSPRMSGGFDVPGFPASKGDRKPVSPGSRWSGMDYKRELEATPDPELIPTPEPNGDLEVTTEKEGLTEDQYEIGTYRKVHYPISRIGRRCCGGP